MSDFYESLKQTEYGETLSSNVRFGRFKPETLENHVWVDILGADVDNLEHMEWTAGIASWYVYEAERLGSPLSEEDKDTLITTAWVHDFAEAIDGDIPDPYKDHTEDAKAKEKRSFIQVASSITDDPEKLGEKVFPVMYGTGELARHFRAIELIGYNETALRAGIECHHLGYVQEMYGVPVSDLRLTFMALVRLHDEVSPSARKSLEAFIDLPVVEEYLHHGS